MPAEAACVDGTPTNCSGGGPQDVCLVTTVFNPFGGAGDDALIGDLETGAGAHGVDELSGGSGDDVLCSGGKDSFLTGVEVLEGDDDDDMLWSDFHPLASSVVVSATMDGGADTGVLPADECGGGGSTTNCETNLLSSPCW